MRLARGADDTHTSHDSAIVSSTSSTTTTGQDETAAGLPVSVAASFVDGSVLTTTPNGHVYNYRSAVVFGYASMVDDGDEKLWAIRKTTESLLAGHWDNLVLLLAKSELASVSVLIKIKTGSAKIRTDLPSATP